MSPTEMSPYEILEIQPSATNAEVITAYQRALKQRRYPANRVTQAFNELRNPRRRAEHDLLVFSDLGEHAAIAQAFAGLPPPAFVPREALPVKMPISLPEADELAAEELEIPECPVELATGDAFAVNTAVLPPIDYLT